MRHRKIEIVRGLWGVGALVAPGAVLHLTGGDDRDPRSRAVMRILGARQCAQSVLSGVSPSASVLAMGVWVDAVHCSSGVALAVARHRYAKPALVDAAFAAGWAAVGFRDLRGARPDNVEATRSKLADAVLGRVPGGSLILSRAKALPRGDRQDGFSAA